MKTQISSFCNEFQSVLAPINEPLQSAIDSIKKEGRHDVLAQPLAGLQEAGHRFQTLHEKIQNQHAYLIIFGPLKSGKSTLMNAITRSYVSEVTALPAYPCLVYVSDGDKQSFNAIKYNGNQDRFSEHSQLQTLLEGCHAALADRIRVHEGKGEEFDPREHYKEAIRRIDVKVPLPSLHEANTVLVDTPGLYSRMKFGYDLMTREFRDTASCAVFVVKSDNLFLEQVFDEFNTLLDLFSRIFLVVNIDAGKRDLQADGSLGPSLESRDPQKIVEAFKSLSMSGPMRKAYDEGRLKIYPIDLLSAASGFLRGDIEPQAAAPEPEPTPEPQAAVEEEADPDSGSGFSSLSAFGAALEDAEAQDAEAQDAEETDEETEPEVVGVFTFDEFLNDLTDYLNSNDYLREFEGDSLRQGATICREIRAIHENRQINEFEDQNGRLKKEQTDLNAKLGVVKELLTLDLKAALSPARDSSRKAVETNAKKTVEGLKQKMNQAVDTWMDSDDSLQTLFQSKWKAMVEAASVELNKQVAQDLTQHFNTPAAGTSFDYARQQKLKGIGLDLVECAQGLLPKLQEVPTIETKPMNLDVNQLVVKRSFWDWICFRSVAKVRERLFGPADAPDIPVPAELKAARLPEEAVASLRRTVDAFLNDNFPEPQVKHAQTQGDAYAEKLIEGVTQKLSGIKSDLIEKLNAVNRRLESNQRIIDCLAKLEKHAEEFDRKVEGMLKQHEDRVALLAAIIEPAVDVEEADETVFPGEIGDHEPGDNGTNSAAEDTDEVGGEDPHDRGSSLNPGNSIRIG